MPVLDPSCLRSEQASDASFVPLDCTFQAPEVEEPVNDPIDAADEYRDEGGKLEKGSTAVVPTPKTTEMAWGRGESTEDQSAPIVDKRPEAEDAEGKEGRRERGRTTSRGAGAQLSPLGSLLRHHKGELFLAFLVATLWSVHAGGGGRRGGGREREGELVVCGEQAFEVLDEALPHFALLTRYVDMWGAGARPFTSCSCGSRPSCPT